MLCHVISEVANYDSFLVVVKSVDGMDAVGGVASIQAKNLMAGYPLISPGDDLNK